MYFYIRDKRTFAVKTASIGYDYDIVIDSLYDDNSSVTIEYDDSIECGDIITNNNGYYGIITEKEKAEDDTLNLTCANILYLFDREVIYNASSSSSIEGRLKDYINENIVNNYDDYFKVSYLRLSTGSSTIGDILPDINDGTYNLMEFIGKVRSAVDIFLEYSVVGRELHINIVKKSLPTKTLILDGQPISIEEETFSDEIISKVICFNSENSITTDYYLLKDRSITTDASNPNRLEGKYTIVRVSSDEDTYAVAEEMFKNNEYAHKIVFSSPSEIARYNFKDKLSIQLNRNIYSSYIASVKVNSHNLTTYQCGELETTLTDKMRTIIGHKQIADASINNTGVASITDSDIEEMW